MSDANISGDLNQVISSAVQARIEAEVAAALSGSEVMGQYVAAALSQQIEIKDPRDSYRTIKTTFLRNAIDKAIQKATAAALTTVVEQEMPAIEQAVTTELRKNVKGIATQLVGQVAESVDKPYGITVQLNYPNGR